LSTAPIIAGRARTAKKRRLSTVARWLHFSDRGLSGDHD
jgi:hypothetical protein